MALRLGATCGDLTVISRANDPAQASTTVTQVRTPGGERGFWVEGATTTRGWIIDGKCAAEVIVVACAISAPAWRWMAARSTTNSAGTVVSLPLPA